METIIIHPKNKEQLAALKTVAKAFKVPFEIYKDSSYSHSLLSQTLPLADYEKELDLLFKK